MYESFFLRAFSPTEPLSVWIRYTVEKRPDERPCGSVWCTVFDGTPDSSIGERPGPFMCRESTSELSVPPGGWIEVGLSRFGPDRAEGSCGTASWSLRFDSAESELRHLPWAMLYKTPLPRTKLTSPMPAARFSGTLRIGEREIELEDWLGMVGHNWGAEHAERWIWLHGAGFEQAPDAWLDVAIGRILVAGRMSPWVANGALSLDGRRMRLGGIGARGLLVAESPARCSLSLPGPGGLHVEAHVEVPTGSTARWRYADPDGGAHDVLNCSIASLTLSARLQGEPGHILNSPHGAAYELGLREGDHGIC
jgi:hypothetical protein